MAAAKAKLGIFFQALAIVLSGVWVCAPAIHGEWVWDDAAEIGQNPVLRDGRGIGKIWISPAGPDYFPLKTTLQWVEWHLWRDNRVGYHLVSIGLHALSALLFWRLLRKIFMDGDFSSAQCGADSRGDARAFGAWIGGLIFAIHPLTVESVGWIAEFKNTLSLPPLLLAMSAWVDWFATEPPSGTAEAAGRSRNAGAFRYAGKAPSDASKRASGVAEAARLSQTASAFRYTEDTLGRRSELGYFWALFWFLIALLCKTSVVMFPAVLLLYVWWKKGRVVRRDFLAGAPFFGLSLALGLATVWFQRRHAILGADLGIGGPLSRFAAAGIAAAFYLGKFILPVRLAPIYPRWEVIPPLGWHFLPWGMAAALLLWLRARRGGRGAVFALGCFGLNLFPVVGFIPMAYLRLSWVADHFVYLPMLGLVGLAAAGSAALADWLTAGRRMLLLPAAGLAVLVCALLGIESYRQARIFRSDEIFWRYALRWNPDAWLAHNDLGLVLAGTGRLGEAIDHYREVIRLKPDYPEARNNLGNALSISGRFDEATAEFREALRLEPAYIAARRNLGNALAQSGRWAEAIGQYEEVLRRRPDDAEVRCYLGFALAESGRPSDAVGQYREALRLKPDFSEAHYRLGNALGNSGRLAEAIGEYEAALCSRPDFAEARANLGLALAGANRPAEALAQLREALRLKPGYSEAHAYLGFTLAGLSRFAEAVKEYEAALRQGPGNADLHYNLGVALRALGRDREARVQFEEAGRLQPGR